MLQASTTPVVRSVVGGIVLALAGAYAATREAPTTVRLVLHAVDEPDAVYLSAWRGGDVLLTYDGELRPITFEIRASPGDGCRWRATERLLPLADRAFLYTYDETIESCVAGAHPFRPTPRVGVVTIAR